MDNELFDINRKSHIEPDQIYFWAATIYKAHRIKLQGESMRKNKDQKPF